MCMKYEDGYGDCFDHLFFGITHRSWFEILEQVYGVEIVEKGETKALLLGAIEEAHEKGFIRPVVVTEVTE